MKANVGDKIRITRSGTLKRTVFDVIECPEEYAKGINASEAWVRYNGGNRCVQPVDYEVVSVVSDDVDRKLKKRLDDNLRNLFT